MLHEIIYPQVMRCFGDWWASATPKSRET